MTMVLFYVSSTNFKTSVPLEILFGIFILGDSMMAYSVPVFYNVLLCYNAFFALNKSNKKTMNTNQIAIYGYRYN